MNLNFPRLHLTAPLKIIVANDEVFGLEVVTVMLQNLVPKARILSFQKSKTAWEVLSSENPDLLITDDAMPGLWGQQICERLLERKVTYPIIVYSPWPPTQKWVDEFADRGLNVRFLESPFTFSKFKTALEASLNFPSRGNSL